LDVTNSPDGKLYKIVQSNPEDKVDKVVLFGENQQNNFSTLSFDPMLGTNIDLRDKNYFGDAPDPIAACLQYNDKLPDTFDGFKNDLKAQAFFVLLSRGDTVHDLSGNDIYNNIKDLSTDPQNSQSDYENYITAYKSHFLLQNRGYRYTIN
jgi:hypothetical protein